MKQFLIGIMVLFGLTSLFSCGSSDENQVEEKSLAVLDFKELSNTEAVIEQVSINLKKGKKLELWSSVDISYNNSIELSYIIEVWKGEDQLGGFELNAFKTNPTLFSIKKSIGSKTNWSYSGRLDFLRIQEDGEYTIKGVLYCSDPTVELKKAKLFLR